MVQRRRKIYGDARRDLVLAAISDGTRTQSELAHEAGITRTRLYQLVRETTSNLDARLEEAEAEIVFLRRVQQLVGGSDGKNRFSR